MWFLGKPVPLSFLFSCLLAALLALPFEYDLFDDFDQEEPITFPKGGIDLVQQSAGAQDAELLEDSVPVLGSDPASKALEANFRFASLDLDQVNNNGGAPLPPKNNISSSKTRYPSAPNANAEPSAAKSEAAPALNASGETNSTGGQTCFNWRNLAFFDRAANSTVIPFKTCGGGSRKVHGFVSGEEIVFFHEVKGESWKPCSPEVYAVERENTSNIRQISHGVTPELDAKEGLYSFYDEEFRQQLYKLMSDAEFRIQIYKICENRRDAKQVNDIGWVPVKLSRDKPRPFFRTDGTLTFLKRSDIEGFDHDLILIGGESDLGAYNDIWIFSVSQAMWVVPDVLGDLPKIKGQTKLVIFGGNTEGKPHNDVYLGNLTFFGNDYRLDISKIITTGRPPQPREGHTAFIKEGKMIVIGGCNFDKHVCYNDIYALDLEEMPPKWVQINPNLETNVRLPTAVPAGREGFSFIIDADTMLFMNGCNDRGECFKDAFLLELTSRCIFKCPAHSVKKDGACACKKGWGGENCMTKLRAGAECKYNCNNRGACNSYAACVCSENFFGKFCQHEFCTDGCSGNGFCDKKSMKCLCKKGFFGRNCAGNCKKKCNDNGYCLDGKCVCFPGYKGKDCEQRRGILGCWKFGANNEITACFGINDENLEKPSLKGTLNVDRETYLLTELEKTETAENAKDLTIKVKFKLLNTSLSEPGETTKTVLFEVNDDIISMGISDKATGRKESFNGMRTTLCYDKDDCFGNGICTKKAECVCANGKHGNNCQLDFGDHFYKPKGERNASLSSEEKERNLTTTNETSIENNQTLQDSDLPAEGDQEEGVVGKLLPQTDIPEGAVPNIIDQNPDYDCKANCSNNGLCINSTCACFQGFLGEGCEDKICPGNCSLSAGKETVQGGFCSLKEKRCLCFPGFSGAGCDSLINCPNNCSSAAQGLCLPNGRCSCTPSFTGESCQKRRCPNNCNGNGVCRDSGVCECFKNFYSSDCSLNCLNNCSTKGFCAETGKCICFKGFYGEDCSKEKQCEENCNNNGKCLRGECFCDPGFEGQTCKETSSCADNCSDRGICQRGKCLCSPGFAGTRCEFVLQCPFNCYNRGECKWGRCYCEPGFGGPDCGRVMECPSACNGRGLCVDGECFCQHGWIGESCEKKNEEELICVDNCNGNGRCHAGECICEEGWTGRSCAVEDEFRDRACKINQGRPACEGNGICKGGKCFCYPGYFGEFCSKLFLHCKDNCTSPTHGLCRNDMCMCRPGFEGDNCFKKSACKNNCANKGKCFKGVCLCDKGYKGEDCSEMGFEKQNTTLVEQLLLEGSTCPGECNGHGICDNGKCLCDIDFEGEDCQLYNPNQCEGRCTGRGVCKFGRCFCDPGFVGDACEIPLACPNSCSRRGICRHGRCHCMEGFTGTLCETKKTLGSDSNKLANSTQGSSPTVNISEELYSPQCPHDCSNKGLCLNQTCFCEEGYFGYDCSFLESERGKNCKSNCSAKGDCIGGKCYYHPGFFGDDCSKKTNLLCPGDGYCSGRGVCHNGKCNCDPDYTGESCEKKSCETKDRKDMCSGHGICKNGLCFCDPSFGGPACELRLNETGCPNDCSNKGICQNKTCLCVAGYEPPDCRKGSDLPKFRETDEGLARGKERCVSGCSGRGRCVNGECKCRNAWLGEECQLLELPEEVLASHQEYVQKLWRSARNCSRLGCLNGGRCQNDGICQCQDPFVGDLCEETQSERDERELRLQQAALEDFFCLNLECGEKGICRKGECVCDKGYVNSGGPNSRCVSLKLPDKFDEPAVLNKALSYFMSALSHLKSDVAVTASVVISVATVALGCVFCLTRKRERPGERQFAKKKGKAKAKKQPGAGSESRESLKSADEREKNGK